MNTITSKQLKEMINKNEIILVDVREPIEYEAEHIEGAMLIPLAELDRSKLSNIVDKTIVLYCRSGKRSESAYEKIKNYELKHNYYSLKGGILAWKEDGYETIKAKGNFISLERQVHVIIGTTVFIASSLTYFINIKFVFVAGFFGFGLSFAGLTGFCGLTLLIAKAPWNKKISCKISIGFLILFKQIYG